VEVSPGTSLRHVATSFGCPRSCTTYATHLCLSSPSLPPSLPLPLACFYLCVGGVWVCWWGGVRVWMCARASVRACVLSCLFLLEGVSLGCLEPKVASSMPLCLSLEVLQYSDKCVLSCRSLSKIRLCPRGICEWTRGDGLFCGAPCSERDHHVIARQGFSHSVQGFTHGWLMSIGGIFRVDRGYVLSQTELPRLMVTGTFFGGFCLLDSCVAECYSTTYRTSHAVWAPCENMIRHMFSCCVCFFVVGQIKPHDAFGQQMLRNLEVCPLLPRNTLRLTSLALFSMAL
jgi:hypothetical protein